MGNSLSLLNRLAISANWSLKVLKRQKILLSLLSYAQESLPSISFVKLVFLLRKETDFSTDSTFYDFIPYKFGPFSFTLYHELANLKSQGFLNHENGTISLCSEKISAAKKIIADISGSSQRIVRNMMMCHSEKNKDVLLKEVYDRYPWYASRSQILESRKKPVSPKHDVESVIYTVGYEGKSVDAFFNNILQNSIELIIDVRSNPVSRRYGFSKKKFSEIAEELGIIYIHMPELGIPSKHRTNLNDFSSYQNLLMLYENDILPSNETSVVNISTLVRKNISALMCMEKDFRCCHRSRLAKIVSQKSGLNVRHI